MDETTPRPFINSHAEPALDTTGTGPWLAGLRDPGAHQPVQPRAPRYALSPVRRGARGRAELESFVAGAFRDKHGAEICTFMPELLALRGSAGQLLGVAGIRAACEEPLFLEQYLDRPVEMVLSTALRKAVARGQIAEIGNLASAGCRQARYLVSMLPRHLMERGHTWVVFTATSLVRDILASVGATLIELAPADPARLAGGAGQWGAYYRGDPRVMASFLPTALHLSTARRRH